MERELDQAANRTAYFFLQFTPETGDCSENGAPKLKTSADTVLHCLTQHLTAIVRHSCLTARRTVRSIIGAARSPSR
jgi:hypothetical protein